MTALALLIVPASSVLGRVPELLIPAFIAYGMAFLLAFRVVMERSLVGEIVAAAGLRPRQVRRRKPRRILRALTTVFQVLCTMLAAAAAALWIRSHRTPDEVVWMRWDVLGVTPSRWVRRFHDGLTVNSHDGLLLFMRQREVVLDPQYVLNKELTVLPKPWRKLTWSDDSSAIGLNGSGLAALRPGPTRQSRVLDALGIDYYHYRLPQRLPGDPAEGMLWLVVPWRLVCFALAVPPMGAGLLYLLRLRPRKAGHCPNCGYDLRASPDRCPECGEEIVTPTARPGSPAGAG